MVNTIDDDAYIEKNSEPLKLNQIDSTKKKYNIRYSPFINFKILMQLNSKKK
jgi:hypothetical protein